MSVEEALAEIEERLPRQFSNGISRRAALDALVREVRAEMLCYWKMERDDRQMCPDADVVWSRDSSICPTCTARAEREALKVEAR